MSLSMIRYMNDRPVQDSCSLASLGKWILGVCCIYGELGLWLECRQGGWTCLCLTDRTPLVECGNRIQTVEEDDTIDSWGGGWSAAANAENHQHCDFNDVCGGFSCSIHCIVAVNDTIIERLLSHHWMCVSIQKWMHRWITKVSLWRLDNDKKAALSMSSAQVSKSLRQTA